MLLLVVAAVLIWQGWEGNLRLPTAGRKITDAGEAEVARVVDGDTLVLNTPEKDYVRLIGADTPETVKPQSPVEPWGPEATAFTKNFVRDGTVRLQFDGRRRDKHGRLLAYVWVGDRMLNEELLRAGLARFESEYSYSREMKDRFQKAEAEAQAARRGVWSGK